MQIPSQTCLTRGPGVCHRCQDSCRYTATLFWKYELSFALCILIFIEVEIKREQDMEGAPKQRMQSAHALLDLCPQAAGWILF